MTSHPDFNNMVYWGNVGLIKKEVVNRNAIFYGPQISEPVIEK